MPDSITFSPRQIIEVSRSLAGRKESYTTTVRTVSDDGIEVDHPKKQGRPILITANEKLEVCIITGDGHFGYEATPRQRLDRAGRRILRLPLPTSLKRLERRKEPRYEIKLPITYIRSRSGKGRTFSGKMRTRDISVGGACAETKQAAGLSRGNVATVEFHAKNGSRSVKIEVNIVNLEVNKGWLGDKTIFHMQFLKGSERVQRDILELIHASLK